jgi:hypothetical protein
MPRCRSGSQTYLGHSISLSWGRSVCWHVRLPSSRPQKPAASGRDRGPRRASMTERRSRAVAPRRLIPQKDVIPQGAAGDLRVVNVLEAERDHRLPVLVVELADAQA